MGQLRTDSKNRSNRRPWSRLGKGNFPASLWSIGKGDEGPGLSPGHTSPLHSYALPRSTGDVQCRWGRETEAQSRLPTLETCSACPATSITLENHHASHEHTAPDPTIPGSPSTLGTCTFQKVACLAPQRWSGERRITAFPPALTWRLGM